ncbi:MAG: lmo0937 family membrane protein [Candidatus Brocadiia bacterium]
MYVTIAVIVLAVWLVGLVASVTVGGLIHVLLIVAIIALFLRIYKGKPA